MAKSAIGKILGTARTVKSAVGLAEWFVNRIGKITDSKGETDHRLSDEYGGNTLLYYPDKAQNRLWKKFYGLEDQNRRSRILEAWVVIGQSKLEPIKLRVSKSKSPEKWKAHLNNWEKFISKCREEQNKLS